ncbi:MAG TPA: hypothetical protein VLA20_00315 [Vicinamibacterales bacterium]|nr:hypothetical protein [Vicinamibacterales bacterium]
MSTDDGRVSLEEYAALRATIRERGTLRLAVLLLTFVAWAALVIAGGLVAEPLGSLVTLLVLAAGFEVVFAAHVGVERVGRYLQARYESDKGPAWEHVTMAIGRSLAKGPKSDPLGFWLFVVASLVNLASAGRPLRMGMPSLPVALAVGAHAVFVWRLVRARRYAAVQRERDLAFLKDLDERTKTT